LAISAFIELAAYLKRCHADRLEIVRTDALHQQEAARRLAGVGDAVRGLGRHAAARADRQAVIVARRARLDLEPALETEVPVGDRAVEMPRDGLADPEREVADLQVGGRRHGLDRGHRVGALRHADPPRTNPALKMPPRNNAAQAHGDAPE
jgi:hypothetical protein